MLTSHEKRMLMLIQDVIKENLGNIPVCLAGGGPIVFIRAQVAFLCTKFSPITVTLFYP